VILLETSRVPGRELVDRSADLGFDASLLLGLVFDCSPLCSLLLLSLFQAISMKDIKDRLVTLCQDPKVAVLDKLRLVMIYMISQGGMQATTRQELLKNVDVELQDALRNLDALGVDLSNSDKSKKKVSKERQKELELRNKSNDLALMRYLPVLHGVMESLVTGTLKEESFPYTAPPPPGSMPAASSSSAAAPATKGKSARKKANSSDWKSGDSSSSSSGMAAAVDSGAQEDLRPRFFVFVLGGVTFSEMRSAYEIAEQRGVNLYIGSTDTLTPTQFIEDLSNLPTKDFEHAVEASTRTQASGAGAAASSSSARPAAGASVPMTATRRGPIVDSDDEDDQPPVNLHKLNVKV
jgi:hypothetical protein